jgi:plastocyanin
VNVNILIKNSVFISIFLLFGLLITNTFIGNAFAQLGLAPLPTSNKVLPTYIIDIPAGAVIQNKSTHYVPEKVAIPSGTTIAWFNDDPGQTHTVTSGLPQSPDAGKLFNSGIMPEGSFFQYTFTRDTAGDYTYYCTLHPWMNGIIHVSDSGELGNFFKFSSGERIIQDDFGIKWIINKTQYNRVLLNFEPLSMKFAKNEPITYNIKLLDGKNETIYSNNFLTLGSNLQIELISSKANKTTTYGPDFTDPSTGAYHIEGNFSDGDYKIDAQLLSIGSNIVKEKQIDRFEGKIVS